MIRWLGSTPSIITRAGEIAQIVQRRGYQYTGVDGGQRAYHRAYQIRWARGDRDVDDR
jgi:hypothetical protein